LSKQEKQRSYNDEEGKEREKERKKENKDSEIESKK
jgi:hypothetical protein